MIEARQQAYLEAMGISVWSLREPDLTETSIPDAHASLISDVPDASIPDVREAPLPDTDKSYALKLGPGRGGILLICASNTDSASKLANDIGRALGKVPVWSWLDDAEDAVKPVTAVDENLFTTVAVFGSVLAEQLFGSELPANLNSANLVLLPSMRDLESRPDARQSLWVDMCRSGMVSAN